MQEQLAGHRTDIASDPQANTVKTLAYDVSKDVEDRHVAFRNIEELVKSLSDTAAIARARRLRERAGMDRLSSLKAGITKLAKEKAKDGFEAFKAWAETPAQGIVLTAHPTFSLSRDIRNCLGQIASKDDGEFDEDIAQLKTYPYLPKRAPTLIEEHEDTQATLHRIQSSIDAVNAQILDVAAKAFPDQWTTLAPHLIDAYSWVGYDIDGRTDISWGDALRLRLSEKRDQLARYLDQINALASRAKSGCPQIETLQERIEFGLFSSKRDLAMFEQDITEPDNLVAAANNLTRDTENRILNLADLDGMIDEALSALTAEKDKRDLLCIRASMKAFGLGTARIHFRLNARHVMTAIRPVFNITDNAADNRTLMNRASKITKNVKAQPVNFASLALEKNTAHEKMILTAQIHKYIDNATPIRLLIAETEDSLVPLGMLYLARLYGLEEKLDISPLFETADALNNGGRIIGKMLENPVYNEYIKTRGLFAIQTGFSDAGRFMGQIPATLRD
ncbi:phosphoenolpyruvate carboxylase [Litorimonas sp. RW-G-Af-16]|uniref:phosphoenolpyruvate carboxylase n=1 Tax=Litorimonas sp. RW-G-Af-16 TaxID=3241168 RepID=UPI003AABCB8E